MEQNQNSNLASKATILTDLIDYQEGAVVSRTLIDKNVGTVTLFAFDKGQSLSEHTSPFDALVYIFDGEAQVTVSGKPINLKPGTITVMPAHKPHAVKSITQFKMMLILIRA